MKRVIVEVNPGPVAVRYWLRRGLVLLHPTGLRWVGGEREQEWPKTISPTSYATLKIKSLEECGVRFVAIP